MLKAPSPLVCWGTQDFYSGDSGASFFGFLRGAKWGARGGEGVAVAILEKAAATLFSASIALSSSFSSSGPPCFCFFSFSLVYLLVTI